MHEIYSKLRIKATELCHWQTDFTHCSSALSVGFKQINASWVVKICSNALANAFETFTSELYVSQKPTRNQRQFFHHRKSRSYL